jgi:hypothetical protein
MTKLMWAIVALSATGLLIVACGGTTTSTSGEDVGAPAGEAPVEEAAAEEAPAGEIPAETGPCAAYAACCNAYAEALGAVEGVPVASVDATKENCVAIEGLKDLPTAADSCQQFHDDLKAGMEAYKAMQGFVYPAVCE